MNIAVVPTESFIVPRKKLSKDKQPTMRKRKELSGSRTIKPVHVVEMKKLSDEDRLHLFDRARPARNDDMDADVLAIRRSLSAQAMHDRKVELEDGTRVNAYATTKRRERPGRNPNDPLRPVSSAPTAAEVLAEIRNG